LESSDVIYLFTSNINYATVKQSANFSISFIESEEAMRRSSNKGSGMGCLIVLAVLLVIGLVQSVVRYISDKPRYDTAHAAYLTGNCGMATQYYKEYIDKFRLFDFGRLKDKA
jgi:uncharacterized membrane protein